MLKDDVLTMTKKTPALYSLSIIPFHSNVEISFTSDNSWFAA